MTKWKDVTRNLREWLCPETDRVIGETHRDDEGHTHRVGAAAERWFYPDGRVSREDWCKYSQSHRLDDLPATTCWDEQGRKTFETYAVNGVPTRRNGKANHKVFDPASGKVAADIWLDEDWHMSRRIRYDLETGNRKCEEFFRGQTFEEEPILHHDTDAARIIYNPATNDPVEYQFFDDGLQVDNPPSPDTLEL